VNPPKGESRRLSARETLHINEAIDAAVAGAGVTRDWVRGHFVHHGRASYLVIPNLYSAATEVKDEEQRQKEARWALAMNQLAGVLSDMELVRWPDRGIWRRLQNIPLLWKGELQRLKYEPPTPFAACAADPPAVDHFLQLVHFVKRATS